MSASASTSISTKRTRSRSYSSTTEASIGRTRAHGAHPSAPKNATNAFVSRGESPKKLSPAYRRLNASAPRWRTDSGSNGKTSETSDVFCLRPDETSFAPGRMSESRSACAKGDGLRVFFSSGRNAARTFFTVSPNAVVIAEFGRERGSVVLSVCGRSTGPCHRSAATPAAKPLPRATKTPGILVVSVVSFFSTSSSSAAYIPRIVSETTSVRA
mmetsp:Transcript_5588/g.23638  ORF Transcript_5588/g.23638 Transcript_5588/m.23638 type:complete len:214 (+) Transcript_5588:303-944(+)